MDNLRSIMTEQLFDVLSCHLYTSRNDLTMYTHVPYETVIEGKKINILNVNWHAQVIRWTEFNEKVSARNAPMQRSALYRYLTELDNDTFVVFNTAFEPYYMHADQRTSNLLQGIIEKSGVPVDRFIVLTPNKEAFLEFDSWEGRMNVVGYNALMQIYYNTRRRLNYINENLRTKHFTSLCGTARLHRVDLYTFLRLEDLLDTTHYTFNAVNAHESWKRLQGGNTYYSRTYHHIIDLPSHTRGSFKLRAFEVEKRTEQHNDMPDCYFDDAYVHLLTETCYHGYNYKNFLTEKTIKIFDNFQIPLVVGTVGYVKYLRSLGYHMFDNIIDHSYDDIVKDRARFEAITKEIRRLAAIPLPQLHELYHQNREALEHNREQVHRHYVRMYEEFNNDFRAAIHANKSR